MKERITRRYLAGLLDGEGYFGIMKPKYEAGRRHYVPAIKLVLTTPDVIKEIALKLGGHIHIREFDNPRWNTGYCWESKTFKQVDKVLSYVHEYLIIKKPQADLLREFLKTQFKSEIQNNGSTPLPKEILEKRDYLYSLMSKLNYRGRPLAENKRDSSTKVDEAMFRPDMKISDAERNLCAVAI